MAEPRSAGRDWVLGNGEEHHAGAPRSFFIPSRGQREALQPGALAQVMFELSAPGAGRPRAERMWLEIASRTPGGYVGHLTNTPTAIADLVLGDLVAFGPEHVIGVADPKWNPFDNRLAVASARLLTDDTLEPEFVRHDAQDEGRVRQATGDLHSGWQLYVGDETDEELETSESIRLPNLAWLMGRYPAFGALVFSGARDGDWELADGRYVDMTADGARVATQRPTDFAGWVALAQDWFRRVAQHSDREIPTWDRVVVCEMRDGRLDDDSHDAGDFGPRFEEILGATTRDWVNLTVAHVRDGALCLVVEYLTDVAGWAARAARPDQVAVNLGGPRRSWLATLPPAHPELGETLSPTER